MSLNTIKVQNLKPKKADYRIADGGGLYLLVRPNGSKLWRYDYRLNESGTGKTVRRTFSIGEFRPDGDAAAFFTLAQARAEYEMAREAVEKRQHPVSPARRAAIGAQAKADAGDTTFGGLADQWLAARKIGHSPKTYARDERSVKYLKTGYRRGKGFADVAVDQVETAHLSRLAENFNKPTRIRVVSTARKIMAVAKRKGLSSTRPSPR